MPSIQKSNKTTMIYFAVTKTVEVSIAASGVI